MSLAMLFPGQGSQSLGMCADLASRFSVIGHTFDEASEAMGIDLWQLTQEGPEAQLNQTEFTQPVMLSADIATWRVWLELGGVMPQWLAGHSLGEYAALVAAGALNFTDAVRVVARRGQLMQAATPQGVGAMAAVLGMGDADLEAICQEQAQGQVVSCANFNAPGQVVIAGHAEAVARTCAAAGEAGARRAIELPVSVPSHCALMKDAAQSLSMELQSVRISTPAIPVLHNADVAHHDEPAAIRDALERQLWQPVRWTETIQALASKGVERFAECGPGKVLAGLNRRIDRALTTTALVDSESLIALQEAMDS